MKTPEEFFDKARIIAKQLDWMAEKGYESHPITGNEPTYEDRMNKIEFHPIKNPTETIEISPANTITFNVLGEAVLHLDKEGFTYLGERITDAGKAYNIWMEVILKMKAQEK